MDLGYIVRVFNHLVGEDRTEFVIGPNGEVRPERGFAVGAGRCETVEEAVSRLREGQLVGYWTMPETGEVYVDLIEIYATKGTAMMAAFVRGQVTIYDFANDQVIDCSHFYEKGNEGVQRLQDNET